MLAAAALAMHHVLASPPDSLRAADAAMTTLVVGAMLCALPARLAGACVGVPCLLVAIGVALERLILPRVHAGRRRRRAVC
tara:strand:+ start:487 stop:729 length:243 start_codon:yes stop_codon:yes gene_type:complete